MFYKTELFTATSMRISDPIENKREYHHNGVVQLIIIVTNLYPHCKSYLRVEIVCFRRPTIEVILRDPWVQRAS
jgi:hypothetical protein